MSVPLVLLAGDVGYNKFMLESRNKALLDIAGSPLLDYTLRAIGRSSQVSVLVVVGPRAVLDLVPSHCGTIGTLKVPQGDSVSANLRLALEALRGVERFAVITNDAPLITSDEIDLFVRMSRDTRADIVVAASQLSGADTASALGAAYRRSMVPLKDGAYLLGNMFGLNARFVRVLAEINRFFELRKQANARSKLQTIKYVLKTRPPSIAIWRWLRLVVAKGVWEAGFFGAAAFRLSITLDEVEEGLNRVFSDRVKVALVRALAAGACWDVDTERQLEAVRQLIERARADSSLAERKYA